YQRRYDDVSSDLKVIETLHYHTINENAYINNLNKSLEAANIQVKEDGSTRYDAKIKSKFKKTNLYRYGKIYINQVIPTSPEDYQGLPDYQVSPYFELDYETAIEKQYGADKEVVVSQTKVVELKPERIL